MRRALPVAAVAAVVFAAWVSYGFAQDAKQAGGPAAKAWEYRVLVLTDVVKPQQALQQEPGKTGAAVEATFNDLGQDGWEYCGDLPGAVVFKRPKL